MGNSMNEPKFLARVRELLEENDEDRFLTSLLEDFQEELGNYTVDIVFPSSFLHEILENSFLPETVGTPLEACLAKLETAFEQLYGFLMSKSCVGQDGSGAYERFEACVMPYLDAYFQLMRNTLKEWKALKQGIDYVAFLRGVLNIGCVFQEDELDDHRDGLMTPIAPNYMAAVWELLLQLRKTVKRSSEDKIDKAVSLSSKSIVLEVLLAQLCRYMRWFVVSPQGQLCHAALRAYSEERFELERYSLRICPLSCYSSFEGVRELRLFEKIKYELEAAQIIRPGKTARNEFRILVAGDLSSEKFRELCYALKGWIDNRQDEIRWTQADRLNIHFKLFTRNHDQLNGPQVIFDNQNDSMTGSIVLDGAAYEEFLENPPKFKEEVRKADLVFLLDCKELYGDFTEERHPDLSGLMQLTNGETYSSMLALLEQTDLLMSPDNRYYQFQNLLIGGAYFDGRPAFLKKPVNTTMLDCLKDSLKDTVSPNPYKGTAYVYLSDLRAAQEVYWTGDYFVREEQYSGKKFAILRYGQNRDVPLERLQYGGVGCNRNERTIVFNLWQFVKHLAINQASNLLDDFFEGTGGLNKYRKLYLLSEMLIGFDYSDWPNSVKVSCGFYKEIYENPIVFKAGDGFKNALMPYFEKIIGYCFCEKSMPRAIWRHIKQCIDSLLYSDTKSIDDVLFLHLYRDRFELLKTYPDGMKWDDDLYKLIYKREGQSIKYSGKRHYLQAISDYDTSARFFENQYLKLDVMEEHAELVPREVFLNICEVCVNNHYKGSYLYKNCVAMLGGDR